MPGKNPIRISHVITGLETGGAEMMLLRLVSRLDPGQFRNEVISLTGTGPTGEKLEAAGIPVRALGMRPGLPNPFLIWRLARWLRKSRPQLVHTWMYHADLIGGLANWMGAKAPLIWCIRLDRPDPAYTSRSARWAARTCAHLSTRLPERILFCSETARGHHAALGYDGEKAAVIPNGFDLDIFRPDAEAYQSVRRELGLADVSTIIAMVGRWNPQKDHGTFIEAARLLHRQVPEVHFMLCGTQITWENETLARLIDAAGLRGRFHLVGRRHDMPRLTAAFDIAGISSIGEGFPNVVGEAMACAVPCVVTDVGDAPMIVGETGLVIPPGRPEILCSAWLDLLGRSVDERRQLGASARRRISEKFEIGSIVARYEAFYRVVLHHVRN